MTDGQPSKTALGVARRRALHQELDRPLVFEDPLAARILIDTGDFRHNLAALRSPPRRAFIVARSRFAENQLALSFTQGIRQYVILGAGLDTFAYRNPWTPALRVFEVDHPASQAWKRAQLAKAGIPIPSSITFVPADFERQTLAAALAAAPHFNPRQPAFLSLMGVAVYLTSEAFLALLRDIAAFSSGSGVAFDYVLALEHLKFLDRLRVELLAAHTARSGEAFRLFLDPIELETTLRSLGFTSIEDLDPPAINARYFKNRTDTLSVGPAAHLLCARI